VRDRAGNGAFELIIAPPLKLPQGSREETLLGAACEYAGALEPFVRAHPECFVGWRRVAQLTPG